MISFVLCRDTQICFNFLRYNRISRSILAWYRNLTVFMQIYLLNIGEILKWSVKKLIHKHMEYLCIHLYILITQKMETFRRGYSFLTLSFILYSYYLQSLQRLSTRVCKYFRPVMSILMMNWPWANGTIGLLAQKAVVLV